MNLLRLFKLITLFVLFSYVTNAQIVISADGHITAPASTVYPTTQNLADSVKARPIINALGDLQQAFNGTIYRIPSLYDTLSPNALLSILVKYSKLAAAVPATDSIITYNPSAKTFGRTAIVTAGATPSSQTINATASVTAWNSVIQIGATPLTANIVITLPTVVGNTNKTIVFQRLDNTAFSVTIVANGAEILTLPSFASELQLPNGTITIQAIDATNARQVSNIGVSPTIAEFGEAFPSTATVVTTLAPQDYIFFTLPTIGVWEIETTIRSATTTTGGVSFLLTDNSNVTLANSEGKSTFANSTNTQGSGSTTYRITVTVPNSIYKCRVFSDGTVGSSATTDPNGRSSVKYKKIAGFTPVLGTTIDGMSIIAGADQTTALSVGSPVLFPSPIITGGGSITQLNGVFTLPANKSFLLEGGIVYTNGTELIYRWRNITTNTLIGQTGDVFLTSAGREPAARARVDVSATPVTVRLEIISNTGVTNTGSSSDGRGNWATIIQVGSSGFNVLGIANGGTGSNIQTFANLSDTSKYVNKSTYLIDSTTFNSKTLTNAQLAAKLNVADSVTIRTYDNALYQNKASYLIDTATMLAKRDTQRMLNGLVARLPASSSVSTIQTLNTTGTVTAWNSTIQIGATALTANIVITLPTVVGNTGKLITFQRIDNTAFTVTIVANGAEILTLPSFASELQLPNGTITIQAIDATNARQVSNIGVSPTIAEFSEAFPATAIVTTTVAPQDYITFTLPTVGVWEIETTIRSSTVTTGGLSFFLSDNSNTTLANSEGKSTFANSTNTQGSGSTTYRITVTVPNSIYKVRVFSDGTVGSATNSDPNGRSSVKYKKIAGFTPIVGTTIDVLKSSFVATTWSGGQGVAVAAVTTNPQTTATSGFVSFTANFVTSLTTNAFTPVATGVTCNKAGTYVIRFKADVKTTSDGSGAQLIINGAVLDVGKFNESSLSVNTNGQLNLQWMGLIPAGALVQVASIRFASAGSDFYNNASIVIEQVGSTGFSLLPIANGGTGSSTQNFVDLTTNQTINGIKTFNNTTATTANEFNIIDASLTTGAPMSVVSTSIAKLTGFKGESIIVNGALTTASQTTVGLGIANTHTGSAETNVGLQVDANGATNNYGIIVPTGLVGIGTSTPTSTLQVSGSISTILNTVTAAAYTALASDYAIRLTLVGNQVLTLPTPISCPGRSYLISNPTGYLKSFAASVIGVDGVATTLIISNCTYTIQSDGVNFNIISGIKAHTATKLFVGGALTTGSLIVGGIEFSLTAAGLGATCFLQARLVGLPATRTMTSIVSRDSHQAATSIVGEIINPSMTTTYQNLNTATTALANAYLTDIYVLDDRTTGERWDIILSSDGGSSGLLFVRYVAP